MKKETIVNGLSVAAKVTALQPNFLLLTIKHKLTLFRIRRVEVLHNFSQLAL
jgi:hypothetical protein